MERRVILASHSNLSRGLKDTAEMIVGVSNYPITVYSLEPGHHPEEFLRELEKDITSYPDCEYVVLTDIFGASVCTTMAQLLKYSNVVVFSGMNLNLLLSVLIEYPNQLTKSDIERIISDAREGIRSLSLTVEADEEDF